MPADPTERDSQSTISPVDQNQSITLEVPCSGSHEVTSLQITLKLTIKPAGQGQIASIAVEGGPLEPKPAGRSYESSERTDTTEERSVESDHKGRSYQPE